MRPFVQLEPELARTTFPSMYWVERGCQVGTSMLREAGRYVSRWVEQRRCGTLGTVGGGVDALFLSLSALFGTLTPLRAQTSSSP